MPVGKKGSKRKPSTKKDTVRLKFLLKKKADVESALKDTKNWLKQERQQTGLHRTLKSLVRSYKQNLSIVKKEIKQLKSK